MNIFTKSKKKFGFTLIELLVVIAIIGILAGIVLVALGSVRAKAKDARIKSDMAQLRIVGDLFYGNQIPNSFTGLCANADVVTLQTDIAAQGGTGFLCEVKPDGSAYCIETAMNAVGQFWCVDSTLRSQQYPASSTCGDGWPVVYTCQ